MLLTDTLPSFVQYKEVCPPHKLKDLDALVKSLKGNEAEIMVKIAAWWEEPPTVEPEWEDVNTKSAKKKSPPPNPREGRGPGRGRGRGRDGAGGGGRGAGPERRGLRSSRPSPPEAKSPQRQEEPKEEPRVNGPTPVTSAPAPKGAWGQRGVQPTTTEPVSSPAKPVTPVKPEIREKHVDLVAPEDPTPSGMPASVEKQVRAPSTPTGNVWATKGSAHLIRAEKPRPPPPPSQMRMPQRVEPPQSPVKQSLAPPPEPPAATALENGLSPALSNTESWTAPPSLEMSQSASSVAETALGSLPEVSAPPAPPAMSPRQPRAPAPTNVLNMGHWESGEGDDAQNLDFGFGSFGRESDVVEEPANNASMSAKEAMSPARPPPGLSIGGMPPMPANAVLVHELENKLEGATLGNEEVSEGPKPMTSNLPSQPPPPGHPGVSPNLPPNYNAGYGMGMYNYNTAGNSFMGVPPAGLGVPPHQKSQTGHHTPPVSGGVPQHIPPGGLYGSTAPSAGMTGDSTATSSNDTSLSGIPPGMPNAMQYNPALFYGQQPYQMGQPGVGYGYGYGAQFSGAGFYQQQVMGQSGGYPSYDDQPPQGRGDYASKSSNRYRNNGNQYQAQFNPQQHGYGGQPYNMGYSVEHFNQRGGYGPPDAYGMQPQQQQGSNNYSGGMSSFQDDDHHKGKKGGRGFQQHHQQLGAQQQQQQQPFLGGGETTSSTNQGWSNNNNNNQGGGWGGPSWQGGN